MKNQYKVTKERMMEWAKEFHLPNAVSVVTFSLWCLVGLIGVALLVMHSLFGAEAQQWFVALLFLGLAVFKVFFSRFTVMANRYKVFAKTYGVSEWLRTVELTDEEIIITEHTTVVHARYANIKKIKEKGDNVCIIMNDAMGIRLYKSAFTEGDWPSCQKLLAEKMK